MNISDFRAKVNGYGGIARPSRVKVNITSPITSAISRDLEAFCPLSALPGVYIESEQVRYNGMGLIEHRPIDNTFPSISFHFFCDNNGQVIDYFHQWVGKITNFYDTEGANFNKFSFPDEYQGTIEISLLKPDDTVFKKITLNKVFPASIEDVKTGWDMENQILYLPVTFSYYNWKSDTLQARQPTFTPAPFSYTG